MQESNQSQEPSSIKLYDKDKMALWTFLQGCKDSIEKEEIPPVRLAQMVHESIGLKVNKDHVRRALQLCGIKIFRKPRIRSNQRSKIRPVVEALQTRVEQLEQRAAKAEADLAALTKLVEETAKNLGNRWRMENGRAVPTLHVGRK